MLDQDPALKKAARVKGFFGLNIPDYLLDCLARSVGEKLLPFFWQPESLPGGQFSDGVGTSELTMHSISIRLG